MRELDLSGSVLGERAPRLTPGLAAAVGNGCRRLRLNRVHFGDVGLVALSEAMGSALAASEPYFDSGNGSVSYGLSLTLAENKLTDVGGVVLCKLALRYIAELDLSDNAFSDQLVTVRGIH